MSRIRSAFTLVEVLIVVVIMAILAGLVIPQFLQSNDEAKASASVFDLRVIRSQMVLYESHHDKYPSASWSEMLGKTNAQGQSGTGREFTFGPYLKEVPTNSLTRSNAIVVISNQPAQSGDVTSAGGWLYNPSTGGVWINHADYYRE